jgi:uncharacterized membrane protein YqiK
MVAVYQSARGEGEKVFMLNMLPDIVARLADTVQKVKIDKVSVIDSGNSSGGNGVAKFINQLPVSVISLAEQIENATGVNILNQFRQRETPVKPVSETAEKTVPDKDNGPLAEDSPEKPVEDK